MRCVGCSRPLFMPPPSLPVRDAAVDRTQSASHDSNEGYNSYNYNSTHNTNNNNSNSNNNNNNNSNNDNNPHTKTRTQDSHPTPDTIKKVYNTDTNKHNLMGKIWGNSELGTGPSGLVVYSKKLAYHSFCYDKIKK